MPYTSSAVKKLFDQIAEQEDQLEKEPFLRNEIPRIFIQKYLRSTDKVLESVLKPLRRHCEA